MSNPDKIYMIAEVSRDYDGYINENLEEDYGFILSEDEAQAWVDDKHNFEERYQKHLRDTEARNAQSQKEFEVKTRIWDELAREGVRPRFFRPTKAATHLVGSFEQWKAANSLYTVIEVERASS